MGGGTTMNSINQPQREEPKWFQKAFIGALGGLSLVLLKLIDNQFYIGCQSSNEVIAGYLTYITYLILGTLVATFFVDHDLPAQKIRKSAFILGLLAPSILIALLTKPIEQPGILNNVIGDIPLVSNKVIEDKPKIEPLLISIAYSQEAIRTVAQDEREEEGVKIISKAEVEPKMRDAFMKALGRPKEYENYAFVFGITEDATKALSAAEVVKSAISKSQLKLAEDIEVIKFDDSPVYFLVIGGFSKYQSALEMKNEAQITALKALKEETDPLTIENTSLIFGGKVVSGTSLYSRFASKKRQK